MCRTFVAYSALIAALSGLIYNILAVLLTSGDYDSPISPALSAMLFFYAMYTSFAFVPGVIAFQGISKQRRSKIGTYTTYLGYFWAFVMILTGLVLAIMVGTYTVIRSVEVQWFSSLGYYGFIVIHVSLFIIHGNQLQGKQKTTFIIYLLLNILSVIGSLIVGFAPMQTIAAYFAISLILLDLPMVAAIQTAATYGHLWKIESSEDKVEVSSQDNYVGA